jgi:NAD(P)-dependent dehydrogenase (short-subunit alcohol dehydrogenase family)
VPPLARELAPRRVNAVSPGVTETSWWDPLPRPGTRGGVPAVCGTDARSAQRQAEDAALLADRDDYITGVVLPYDGGLRLT